MYYLIFLYWFLIFAASLSTHDSAGRIDKVDAYITHIQHENDKQNIHGDRASRGLRSSLLNPTSTYSTFDTLNSYHSVYMNQSKGAYTTHIAREMGAAEIQHSDAGISMPCHIPNAFSEEFDNIINSNIICGESSKIFCRKKAEENKEKIHENYYDITKNLYSDNVTIETPFCPNLKDLFEHDELKNKLDKVSPSRSRQKEIIQPLLARSVDYDASFCIDASWMTNYRHFLEGGLQEMIGPIDQTNLIQGNGLKHGLVEGKDYVLVSGEVWKYLSTWFGVKGYAVRKMATGTYVDIENKNVKDALDTATPGISEKKLAMDSDTSLYTFRLVRMKKNAEETANDGSDDTTALELPSTSAAAGSLSEYSTVITNSGTPDDGLDDDSGLASSEHIQISEKTSIDDIMPIESSVTSPIDASATQISISGNTAVSTLLQIIKQTLGLASMQPIRLWHEKKSIITPWTPLPLEMTVKALELPLFSELVVETTDIASFQGYVPSLTPFPDIDYKKQEDFKRTSLFGKSSKLKAIGLQNLGNSCYMNAALQCLMHTSELTTYFLSGVYHSEINSTNPLGTGGQIAKSYATLLNNLVHATASFFSPKAFKNCIGRFNPSFAGYAQQDSQELLAFLLDGMHEDLNRIKRKPYFEKPTLGDINDELIAKTADVCWQLHRKRNDSVIVDLFHGLYKSVLVCPDCDQVLKKK